jgi:hypothetical protein
MCQELTQLITATERMAKSSGDLITWNNCHCSSSSPLAAINLYDFPLETLFLLVTSPLKIVHKDSKETNDDLKLKR